MTKKIPPIDNICQTLDAIDGKGGVGKTLFESISRLTPAVSVELIIKSRDQQSTLLTWRDDELYGPGWHIPGGVLRFKETLIERASKTLENELKIKKALFSGPIGFHEIFNDQRDVRGHFISVVFAVRLQEELPVNNKAEDRVSIGQWCWFDECPENLINNQSVLRKYF